MLCRERQHADFTREQLQGDHEREQQLHKAQKRVIQQGGRQERNGRRVCIVQVEFHLRLMANGRV